MLAQRATQQALRRCTSFPRSDAMTMPHGIGPSPWKQLLTQLPSSRPALGDLEESRRAGRPHIPDPDPVRPFPRLPPPRAPSSSHSRTLTNTSQPRRNPEAHTRRLLQDPRRPAQQAPYLAASEHLPPSNHLARVVVQPYHRHRAGWVLLPVRHWIPGRAVARS